MIDSAAAASCASPSLRLLEGLPGVTAVAALLPRRGRRDALSQLGTTVDELLFRALARGAPPRHFDLGGGWAGFAVCAALRLPRARARATLGRVVRALAGTAERVDGGVRWRSAPEHILLARERRDGLGHYDIGAAHGLPGVLGALAIAARAGVEAELALPLVEGGVRWLLDVRRRRGALGLPCFVSTTGTAGTAHLAWCYGDAGAAGVLATLAALLGRPDWLREAARIGRSITPSHPALPRRIDACFCHGTAGLLHVQHRLYLATHDPALRRGARRWLDRTLALAPTGRGRPGLLDGAAGVGLVLLEALSPGASGWDQLFLLSPPITLES